MKRKSSSRPIGEQSAKRCVDSTPVLGLADLPPQCLGKVFEWVDLRTRVRAMRVCRAVYDGIEFYGPLLKVLSLKQASILDFNATGGGFLVNNEVAVAEADLPHVIAWVTSRFNGHTFELVLESHRLGNRAYKMFLQLEDLKSLRVVLKTSAVSQARFCNGLPTLLRQSAATLECLALDVSVSAMLLSAIAKCRQLRSLTFEGNCSYGGVGELAWPHLPRLERIHVGGSAKFADALKNRLLQAINGRPVQLSTSHLQFAERVISMLFNEVRVVRWRLDEWPVLATIVDLHVAPARRCGAIRANSDDGWEWPVIGLFAERAGRVHRELTVVCATVSSLSTASELRSLLPAFRWCGALPTRAQDAAFVARLPQEAVGRGVIDLSVRRLAASDALSLEQLPVALRSRRQFELKTASLTVRLALLPDYATNG